MYTFGWRLNSEVLPLKTSQVDLAAGTLRLDPGTTKNEEGRVVYFTPELTSLVAAQLERVRVLSRKLNRIVPHLFPHLSGRRQAQRITEFNKRWHTACVRAGLGMFLNVSGPQKKSALSRAARARLSSHRSAQHGQCRRPRARSDDRDRGHKTRSVFDRYHIVSPADLKHVASKLTGTIWAQQPSTALDSAR